MVEMKLEYTGDLRTVATHGPSGTVINTDAPTDNLGKGEAFSPTDLCGAALASCILTTISIKGHRRSWDLKGSVANVQKIMSSDLPRRISQLNLAINIPNRFTDEEKQEMRHIADTCPVNQSLNPNIKVNLELEFS